MNKVRWIAIKGCLGTVFIDEKPKDVRDQDLVEYILQEQYKLNVEEEFLLDLSNDKEFDFVCSILDSHKQDVIESFFKGSLKKSKDFCRLDYLEYYMCSLWDFLEEIGLKRKINDISLCKYLQKDGIYTTYKFTDYGIIYQKLYYITTLFCVTNDRIKPLFTDPKHTLKGIRKNLETGETSFWSYRP